MDNEIAEQIFEFRRWASSTIRKLIEKLRLIIDPPFSGHRRRLSANERTQRLNANRKAFRLHQARELHHRSTLALDAQDDIPDPLAAE